MATEPEQREEQGPETQERQAEGEWDRRQFLVRAAILGLSSSSLIVFIQACASGGTPLASPTSAPLPSPSPALTPTATLAATATPTAMPYPGRPARPYPPLLPPPPRRGPPLRRHRRGALPSPHRRRRDRRRSRTLTGYAWVTC